MGRAAQKGQGKRGTRRTGPDTATGDTMAGSACSSGSSSRSRLIAGNAGGTGRAPPPPRCAKVEVTPEVEHAALQALAACGPAVEASPPWSSYSDHWSRSTGVANLRIGKGKDERRHRPRPAPTTAHGRPRHDLPSFGFGQIAESIMPSYVCKTATRCQHTCPPTFGSQVARALRG